MPKIILCGGEGTSERVYACGACGSRGEEAITIGRQETNTIVLPAGRVSRRHAQVEAEGHAYFLVDLGSDNGTMVNGVRLRPRDRYLLRDNDLIAIDPYRLTFSQWEEQLEQSFNEITDSELFEVKLLKKVLRALDKETLPSLEVLNGVAEGKKVFFTEDLDTLVVGRDPTVDLPIEEYVVSRRHAKLTRHADGIMAQDLGSKNGTYVNNARAHEAIVHDGDRIAFGTIVCIFRNPREVNLEGVRERIKARRPAPAKKPAAPKGPVAPAAETALPDDAADRFPESPAPAGGGAPPDDAELAARERAHAYPTPRARARRLPLSPFELGLLWMGTIVFLTAVVLLVKLLS